MALLARVRVPLFTRRFKMFGNGNSMNIGSGQSYGSGDSYFPSDMDMYAKPDPRGLFPVLVWRF